MNCANHTERTATAFCQNCGKALCPECIRSADGFLLCEPCLLARHPGSVAGSTTTPGSAQAPYTAVPGAASAGQYPRPGYSSQPSPFLAGLLGFIPGVGAMYNGQFIKGLIHVVVFVVLIGLTTHMGPFGLLIAAWVFYQVFDAAHTASARRDGRPLPDPFGLLDLSQRMGPGAAYPGTAYSSPAAGPATGYVPPASPTNPAYGAPPSSGYVPPATNYSTPYTPVGSGYSAVPPEAYYVKRRGEPIGAIILIALGVLFLLNTLDVFDFDWISRGWPVFLLLLGIWLLIRRTTRGGYQAVPPPPPVGGYTPAPPPASGTSLSIYSAPSPASETQTQADETTASNRSGFAGSEEEKR